jgi:hypothetical protein
MYYYCSLALIGSTADRDMARHNNDSFMDLSEFMPSVAAEAMQSEVEIAEEAAISRLRPIQDGLDFWGDRSSPVPGSGISAPGWDWHNVAAHPGRD